MRLRFPVKTVAAVALFAVAYGCGDPASDALLVTIHVDPTVKGDCVVLLARGSAMEEPQQELRLERGDKDDFRVAAYRGKLPAQAIFQAKAWLGACNGGAELKFNAASALVEGGYSPRQDVELAIGPLSPGEDGDGDGYTKEVGGGPDCNDADDHAYPGAPESCLNLTDVNCDGRRGCAGSSCSSNACDFVPASLVFTSPPQALAAGMCSTPIRVEPRDALNRSAPVMTDLLLTLSSSPDAGIRFFAESFCSSLVSGLRIPMNASSTAFHVSATVAGTFTLTASSPGLDAGTQPVVISTCGDGRTGGNEACDDGNTIDEMACPYGTATCTFCNASCTANRNLTGLYCGDGIVSGPEACDDGNTSSCGTCNATCTQLQSGSATGSIAAVNRSDLNDGETFTLNDGINTQVVFEFDVAGDSVAMGRVRVDVPLGAGTNEVANNIRTAINNVAGNLLITASLGGCCEVRLTNDRPGSFGNQPITDTVWDNGFGVIGMLGGAGGDCTQGIGCASDADCAPGLTCQGTGSKTCR